MLLEIVEVSEESIVAVKLSPAGSRRKESLLAKNACLGCEREHKPGMQVRRGLCVACYQAANKALKTRKASQTELIREGRMLPRGKSGPRPENGFAEFN
jgi:protein-arginine kinase activator protein McsA